MVLNFDGSYLLHRCRHTMKEPDWSRMAEMFLERFISACFSYKPSKIFVLWDKESSRRRLDLYHDYKGNREDDPEFIKAYDQARDMLHVKLSSIMVNSILIPGYEADDLAQLVMLKYPEGGIHISDDKDWFLNISKTWKVYRALAREEWDYIRLSEEFDTDMIYEKYLYFKALMGDKNDNVPGIDGIGPVYAKKYAEVLLNKEELDDSVKGQLVRNGYEILQRNLRIFDVRWILYDEEVKEEFNKQLITTAKNVELFDWIRFCRTFESENLLDAWIKWTVVMKGLV